MLPERPEPEACFLRMTEERNALDYLEKAHFYLYQAAADPVAWKWAAIALHGALYGFAICAVRGTNDSNVRTKSGRLISLWKALQLCLDPGWMRMTILNRPLVLSERELWSICLLTHEVRNRFAHYPPALWSLEIHGMPRVAIDVLRVIRFLALDTGNFVHLDEKERGAVEEMVSSATALLRSSRLFAETAGE